MAMGMLQEQGGRPAAQCQRTWVALAAALVALLLIWRPLTFDSLDPQSAAARGVPTVAVSLGFMLLLGLVVAVAVHIIGALLVLSLLVTPAAAAMRVSTGPVAVPLLAAGFGVTAAVGGILLAIARLSGETAPLLFTALNNQFTNFDLNGPMANLPVVIFQFAMSPYENWNSLAWGGAILITFGVLCLNIVVRTLFRKKI